MVHGTVLLESGITPVIVFLDLKVCLYFLLTKHKVRVSISCKFKQVSHKHTVSGLEFLVQCQLNANHKFLNLAYV